MSSPSTSSSNRLPWRTSVMPVNPSRGRAPWTALPWGSRISGFGMTLTTTRATGGSWRGTSSTSRGASSTGDATRSLDDPGLGSDAQVGGQRVDVAHQVDREARGPGVPVVEERSWVRCRCSRSGCPTDSTRLNLSSSCAPMIHIAPGRSPRREGPRHRRVARPRRSTCPRPRARTLHRARQRVDLRDPADGREDVDGERVVALAAGELQVRPDGVRPEVVEPRPAYRRRLEPDVVDDPRGELPRRRRQRCRASRAASSTPVVVVQRRRRPRRPPVVVRRLIAGSSAAARRSVGLDRRRPARAGPRRIAARLVGHLDDLVVADDRPAEAAGLLLLDSRAPPVEHVPPSTVLLLAPVPRRPGRHRNHRRSSRRSRRVLGRHVDADGPASRPVLRRPRGPRRSRPAPRSPAGRSSPTSARSSRRGVARVDVVDDDRGQRARRGVDQPVRRRPRAPPRSPQAAARHRAGSGAPRVPTRATHARLRTSSRLRIFPVAVIGSASRNSTMRGYL